MSSHSDQVTPTSMSAFTVGPNFSPSLTLTPFERVPVTVTFDPTLRTKEEIADMVQFYDKEMQGKRGGS